MTLSSAMLVGFTGIKSNSVGVDTIGDNLANVNTTAFKGQRTLFETMLYRTLGEGEAPSDTGGGTLPRQIGTGSTVAVVQRNFAQGEIEGTGFQSDLAIDGGGFFILAAPDGTQRYTRDGAFRLDADQRLTAVNGQPVQAFVADDLGNVDQTTLGEVVIPLGSASEAIQTTEVAMDGRLDSGTRIASQGAVVMSQALVTATGAPATAATALTDLVDENGLPLFADGDEVTVTGSKGGVAMSDSTFVVGTAGRTLGDFATYLERVYGIDTDPATGGSPGVTIGDGGEAPAGALVVSSNLGEINAIELDGASILNTTGVVRSPFSFDTTTEAVGGGVTTSFGVFDSLGNLVDVRMRMALESKSVDGTVWRFYAESQGDSDLSPIVGGGTITFDPNGQFVTATGGDLSIDRAGVGSVSPLTATVDFSALTGLASADGTSEAVMDSQNGAAAGIMTGYTIDEDGVVTGTFSNQRTRVLGQIALATFVNEEGLLATSENNFLPGPNSGVATIRAPQTGTAGSVAAGMLEQSNVEVAREFINLISASTGISSASRVVRVADELLQELLLLAR